MLDKSLLANSARRAIIQPIACTRTQPVLRLSASVTVNIVIHTRKEVKHADTAALPLQQYNFQSAPGLRSIHESLACQRGLSPKNP